MFAEAVIRFFIYHKPVDITLLEISPIFKKPSIEHFIYTGLF